VTLIVTFLSSCAQGKRFGEKQVRTSSQEILQKREIGRKGGKVHSFNGTLPVTRIVNA
jgi:hypothetical protein